MYQLWIRPGRKPRTQRVILMRLSAEQMPRFTQTASYQLFDRSKVSREGKALFGRLVGTYLEAGER